MPATVAVPVPPPETRPPLAVPWGAMAALAGLLGLRMLGLFMVLPVLALHVAGMPGATPLLGGLALGIYGLTQAIFQVPFGRLSDRCGRKPVILGGLLLFAAGSVLAAMSETPTGIVLGRALQGAGAISAAVIALAGDLTPVTRRTRVMALFGVVIGATFILAFVAGPTLSAWFGVPGLFWIAAAFGLAGMLLVLPLRAPAPVPAGDVLPLARVWPLVLPQAVGIFLLHAIMTATFLAVPALLAQDLALPQERHGWVYLQVLLASVLPLVPLVLLQERRSPALALLLAVSAVGAGQAALAMVPSLLVFQVALAAYFGGFNFIEAQFPALVASRAGAGGRGAALGVYATAQFLGAFAGGVAGGLLQDAAGGPAVLAANAALAAGWLLALLAGNLWRPGAAGRK